MIVDSLRYWVEEMHVDGFRFDLASVLARDSSGHVIMLSLGLPMFLMGDEVRRTQHGNNNAYCQDNETNWYDWSLLRNHADIHRFVKLLTARRLLRDT